MQNVNSAIMIAEDYVKQSKIDEAIGVYQDLINLQPKNTQFHHKLGQIQAKKQNWHQAIALYQKALELGIANPFWTYKNLGDALREINHLEAAITNYQEAINLQPENPNVHDSLGQAQSLKGSYSNAIASYQKALELGIANPFWTYKNLADALQRENRLEEAVSARQAALKLQPNDTNISVEVKQKKSSSDTKWLEIHNSGDNYFKQEKWQESIFTYQQAIELNPDYFWSHYNLGRALSELKEWERAIFSYEKAIELNPNLAEVYSYLGKALLAVKKWEQTISVFKQSIELDEHQPGWVYESLGEALAQANHPQLETFSMAQKPAQDCLDLAEKTLQEGKLTEAVALYQQAIAIQPNSPEAYQKLGILLVQLEKYEEAISTYQQAIKIKPDAKIYHLLATPLEKLKRWEKIVDAYTRAVELNPGSYLYNHRLGNFYYKIGNIKEAISSYHRAIELNPNYAWVHYHLGEALQEEGKLQEAIDCYQTAVKIQPDLQRALKALESALAHQKQIDTQISSSRKKIRVTVEEKRAPETDLALQKSLKIVFYPRFKDKKSYTDHFYRMIWYLNPLIEQIEKITIPVDFEDINPDACPSYLDEKSADFYPKFASKISFNFPDKVDDFVQDIKSSNFLLRWSMDEEKKSVSNDDNLDLIRTKKVWRIDHYKERYAGSFYLKCVVDNDREYEKNLAESQEKLHDLVESLKTERGFIFGTGPSLSQAYNFRFDQGETIACNSMLKNRTLMEYLSPKLIVAADPIFHAGCSAYAADFRKYLCDALEYFQAHLIVPMRDIHIYKHNLSPELVNRVIGIPFETDQEPNLNLLEKFHVTSTGNVLTLYLLPLATTLFNKIGIMGCDGRPLDENKYFWKHDPSSQIVNKMSVIQEAHGAFFEIDYDEYYLTHCDILQKWLTAAEDIGKEICNLTSSYIPALQERESSSDQNQQPTWINVNGASASGEPMVSIIMPARNAAETIATSIKTIQNEQLQEWEVIVINDGSSDETVAVVEQIRQGDPRVGIYHTSGRGVSFARNIGLSVARGKYIGFLDADDLYENQALTKRVKALEENPQWEGVYCLAEIVDDNLGKLGWSIGGYKRKINFSDMHSNIHLASVIAKADLLRRQSFKVGLANGEDWLYLSQVLRAGTELEYIPNCNVAYRIHERSTVLQDFTAHEHKLLEVIDVLYSNDLDCTAPADKYKFGLSKAPDKQLVILKRRISLLSFLLLSRKARKFYECIQDSRALPWDNVDEKSIIDSVRSTTMRYYACPQELWQEKFQQNSSYIQQVFSGFKLEKNIPIFHQTINQICQQICVINS